MDKNSGLIPPRRHGARARARTPERSVKTTLTFESRTKVYCWSVDRGIRPVIKH